VAVHALSAAAHLRPPARLQTVEDVKDAPQLWIERDDFDAAAGNIADVGIVVKLQGWWIASGEQSFLQAGGGEGEHLRADGDIQLFEQAAEKGQIAAGVYLGLLPRVPG